MSLPPRMTPPTDRPEPAHRSGTKAYWRCIYGRGRPRARLGRARTLPGSLVVPRRPAAVRRGKA